MKAIEYDEVLKDAKASFDSYHITGNDYVINSFNLYGKRVCYINEEIGFIISDNPKRFYDKKDAEEYLNDLRENIDITDRQYFDIYSGGELYCKCLLKDEICRVLPMAKRIGEIEIKPSIGFQNGFDTFITTKWF